MPQCLFTKSNKNLSGNRIRLPRFQITLQPGGAGGDPPRRSVLANGFCQNIKRLAPGIPYAVQIFLFEFTQCDNGYLIAGREGNTFAVDRKSTRLNSSHVKISYAV